MKTRNQSNHCQFCNRYFRFKDTYEQHTITCEFLFRSKKEKEREIDTFEYIPSAQDQYKLIQYLASQVISLKKDVELLKGSTIVKKRRMIRDWLNSNENYIPPCNFTQWSKSILLNQDHLNIVFQEDLIAGLKKCIQEYIESSKNPPIRAFIQKQNTIYVMNSADPTLSKTDWIILSCEQFDQWIDCIIHVFLRNFVKWQHENMTKIQSSELEKDKNIEYMTKINGFEDRKRCELRKWLFSVVAKDISSVSAFEFIP